MAKETTKREKMTDEQLLEKFKYFFPDWYGYISGYKRIGSRALTIELTRITDGKSESLVWLYIDDNNWQFGTKLWRKPPENVNKKFKERDRKAEEKTEQQSELGAKAQAALDKIFGHINQVTDQAGGDHA